MPDEPFGKPLSLKQTAHELGISPRTLRRWVREHKFLPPRALPGGKITWFAEDVRVFRYLVGRGMFETGEIVVPEEEED